MLGATLACALLGGATLTVDDDGPADFATITPAILAASDGDAILIQPGTYPPFVLSKSLDLLGPASGPKPVVTGRSRIQGAGEFRVAGLQLDSLSVLGAGRGWIDDCVLAKPVGDGLPTLGVTACELLEISRVTVMGSVAPLGSEPAGVRLEGSEVTIVACSLAGMDGGADALQAEPGGDALRVEASEVFVVGTELLGGDGGSGCGGTCAGDAGDGVDARAGARVILRGSGHVVAAGAGPSGVSVRLGGSELKHSGVALSAGIQADASSVVLEPPTEPYLQLLGSDVPGEARRLEMFGPLGQAMLVFVSRAPAFIDFAHLDEPFWLLPQASILIQVVVTIGNDVPVVQQWFVPDDLVGVEGETLYFQGAYVFLNGNPGPGLLTTNVASFILRH